MTYCSFWKTMFNDTMSLLSSKETVFSTLDVMELLLSLQDMVEVDSDIARHQNRMEEMREDAKIKAIRLALVQNLAEVLVTDCSEPFPI